jgi:hypothetical protein
MPAINFPSPANTNDTYTLGTKTWKFNGSAWELIPLTAGYTGSAGAGYTGSKGDLGYTGSQGDSGYTGSQGDTGYIGSRGDTGFTGSHGDIGYTGSKGDLGYTGSQGVGYTGSQGDIGYTGSKGADGDQYHTTSTSTLNLSTYALDDTITLTTVDLGLDYSAQQTILIASSATPTNHLHARVLTYNAGTGVLTASVSNIDNVVNSSLSSWEVNLDGSVGIRGYTGSAGAGYTGSQGVLQFTQSTSAPGSPNVGDIWVDSYTGKQYSYYNDGDSSQWVELGSVGAVGFTGSAGPTAGSANQVIFKNGSNEPTGNSNLTFDGSILSTNNLSITASSGDEGGEMLLAKPATNSTIAGTGVTIDIYQNRLRFFEQGGSARGAFIDITAMAASAGTPLGTVGEATTSTAASGPGYMGLPQNSKSSAYTLVIGDAGKHIYVTTTATITIPANGTVAYPIGTVINLIAGSGVTITVAITTDTLYLGGTGTTGSRTVAAFGMATLVKLTSTTWIIGGTGVS